MARGDFPFDRHELNLQAIVARPRVRAEVGVPLNDRRPGGPTCRSKRQSSVSIPRLCRSPPLEDVVVLADSAGVALGVAACVAAQGCGASAMAVAASSRPGDVEIPLVGSDGEVSGILCRHDQPAVRHASARLVAPAGGRGRGRSRTWRSSSSTTSTTFSP